MRPARRAGFMRSILASITMDVLTKGEHSINHPIDVSTVLLKKKLNTSWYRR